MKKVLLILCVFMTGLLFGCNEWVVDKVEYRVNAPVFMSANEFRSSVKVTDVPQVINKQGKICFYGGFLYISEPEKGIHIIDNRKPSNPRSVGFIELLGNVDIAVRNNMLYADSYIDLVWFDISNPAKPELKNRLENVFIYALPCVENEFGYDYNECFSDDAKTKGIVVGWKLEKRKEAVYRGDIYYDAASVGSNSGSNKSQGVNGSMSRFGLYKDYLYTIVNDHLSVFNIVGETPVKEADCPVFRNVETLFAYKDYMFMGTPTGMLIYSVENPTDPKFISSLQHVYGCDPVVVEDDLAYVTVRSGNFCGQNTNELFIVDVSDVKNPQQIVSYTMKNPKGLGIDNKTLFLCDDGLKVYKVGDPQQLMSNQLVHHSGMDGYDVIPYDNVLMMIAEDGLYQYDYSDLKNIKQLSKLSIRK